MFNRYILFSIKFFLLACCLMQVLGDICHRHCHSGELTHQNDFAHYFKSVDHDHSMPDVSIDHLFTCFHQVGTAIYLPMQEITMLISINSQIIWNLNLLQAKHFHNSVFRPPILV